MVGKIGETGGRFSKRLDVVPMLLYDDNPKAHKYHSGQFRSSIQKRFTYWKTALRQMGTQTP